MKSLSQRKSLSVSDARSDSATAHIIDQALGMQVCFGTKCAADFLRDNSADIDMVLRVLTRPDLRRKTPAPGLFQLRMYGSVPSIAYRHTHA